MSSVGKILVTGGAGFIGSRLTDRLLEAGRAVVVLDDFSSGRERFLADASKRPGFELMRGDVRDREALRKAMCGVSFVYHLSANADVRRGLERPSRDLEQNTLATFGVLEAMRELGVKGLAFPSTGSVYGEPEIFPTPENAPFPVQTSLYGASKLACEGLIGAYAHGFGLDAWIFRMVSSLGERYTHGHVLDFYRQLRAHPERLELLGDGRQRKAYLHVDDVVDAFLLALEKNSEASPRVLNVCGEEECTVDESAGWIAAELGVSPKLSHGGGVRGWPGDSPHIFLDAARLRALGWSAKIPLREAVLRTVRWLKANPWALGEAA